MKNNIPKAVIAILILIGLGVVSGGYIYGLNYAMSRRDADILVAFDKEKKEKEAKNNDQIVSKIANESVSLDFENKKEYTLILETNFGSMELETKLDYAPETVRNFVSLAYRGYYDNTVIHRIVESPNFGVIQGGDKEKSNGSGGKSAKWVSESEPNNVPDELWKVKPEFVGTDESAKLVNTPIFRAPQFYTKFDTTTGQVVYPKGTILMAKTSRPDSASSQFFINLVDTTLPAQYTAFGAIKDTSVLDKISAEINPIDRQTGKEASDGIPSKEIRINKISINK